MTNGNDAPDDMQPPSWQMPTRRSAVWFWLRSRLLMVLRACRNLIDPQVRRWSPSGELEDAPILAQVRTPLWASERENEFMLVAGKVQNLRIAARRFQATVVPAGKCLSFWQQLGRPVARRGFVLGREVREGCVVPMLGGGICQISNALATCAQRAGFELVEQHAHSARVGYTGDHVDATVFWNYVDLRIRAPMTWRLELTLGATDLVLTIRAEAAPLPAPTSRGMAATAIPGVVMRSCMSCDETSCFRHQPQAGGQRGRTAWLLDAWTPEFAQYLLTQGIDADRLLPMPPRRFVALLSTPTNSVANDWESLPQSHETRVFHMRWASLRRSFWQRRWAQHAGKRQASVVDGQRWLAQAYARQLRPEHTHLLIDQGLLPHLQRCGALGGRSYDVLASALPMDEIQRRLDMARQCGRKSVAASATLKDFRAGSALLTSEIDAMSGARRIITAHGEVAEHWRERAGLDVQRLPWVLPEMPCCEKTTTGMKESPPLVVFPASALARKGVYELAQAMRGLRCRLCVLGSPSRDSTLWQGLEVEHASYASDWIARAHVVVLPAHVEHAPRAALMAVAAGVPVIATPACGLQGLTVVTIVPAGNEAALRVALQRALAEFGGVTGGHGDDLPNGQSIAVPASP